MQDILNLQVLATKLDRTISDRFIFLQALVSAVSFQFYAFVFWFFNHNDAAFIEKKKNLDSHAKLRKTGHIHFAIN